jgi:hypothetical protein
MEKTVEQMQEYYEELLYSYSIEKRFLKIFSAQVKKNKSILDEYKNQIELAKRNNSTILI